MCTNSGCCSTSVYLSFKELLDINLIDVGVVHVHGFLSIMKKFQSIRSFFILQPLSSWNDWNDLNVLGRVGTASCDIGIDHPNLVFQVLSQLSIDTMSLIQQHIQLSCHGKQSSTSLLFDFPDASALQVLQWNFMHYAWKMQVFV